MSWSHLMYKAKPWKGETTEWAHAKVDGHRVCIFKADGKVRALTRNFVDLVDEMDIPWAEQLPNKTSVDGELVIPGLPASSIKSDIGRANFYAFAVPFVSGVNCAAMSVEWAKDFCTKRQIPFVYPLVRRSMLFDHEAQAKRKRLEGWIFKNYNYRAWWKWKLERTIDVVVTELVPGKGKYTGQAGALCCSVLLPNGRVVEIARAGGMTDEQRKEMDLRTIGVVVELRYQNVGSRGRLRHPRFIRYRQDKSQSECNVEQDPNLEKFYNE